MVHFRRSFAWPMHSHKPEDLHAFVNCYRGDRMKRFIISTFFIALVALWAAVLMVNQAQAGSPGSPPLFAPTPTPKGRGPTGPARINTTFTTINGNPLKVLVATDGSAQVQ